MYASLLIAESEKAPQVTAVTVAIALITAFVTAYCTSFGKIMARRHDFDQLLAETTKTHKVVKELELELAQRQLVGETELQYRERQLAEFYGPIYGSIKSTGKLWKLFITGQLTAIGGDVLELFRRQNDVIVDLLKTKSHLVEGSKIPKCFAQFMASVTLFNIGTRVGNGYEPPEIAQLKEASFPDEFFRYFIETTELLKANLDALYKANKIAPIEMPGKEKL